MAITSCATPSTGTYLLADGLLCSETTAKVAWEPDMSVRLGQPLVLSSYRAALPSGDFRLLLRQSIKGLHGHRLGRSSCRWPCWGASSSSSPPSRWLTAWPRCAALAASSPLAAGSSDLAGRPAEDGPQGNSSSNSHSTSSSGGGTSTGAGTAGTSGDAEFDWKLAVVLGGCSFEAYNEPESSNGLPEVTPSGSRIVYTDK